MPVAETEETSWVVVCCAVLSCYDPHQERDLSVFLKPVWLTDNQVNASIPSDLTVHRVTSQEKKRTSESFFAPRSNKNRAERVPRRSVEEKEIVEKSCPGISNNNNNSDNETSLYTVFLSCQSAIKTRQALETDSEVTHVTANKTFSSAARKWD